MVTLPADVLGLVARLTLPHPASFATFNLVCQATHAALPHAFSAAELDDGSPEAPPSQAFTDECYRLKADPTDTPTALAPALLINLDRLGALYYSDEDAAFASAARTGQRFALVRCLRLSATQHLGAAATPLFTALVVPHLRSLRQLFVCGADHQTPHLVAPVLPFWQTRGFAHVVATLSELTVCASFDSVAPLAAHLAAYLPALAAASFTLLTAHDGQQGPEHCSAVTVDVPSHLRLLAVAVHMLWTDDGIDMTELHHDLTCNAPLTVIVTGQTANLRTLRLDSCRFLRNHHTTLYCGCRPLTLTGLLPTLTELDVLTGNEDMEVFRTVSRCCPQLAKVVVRVTIGEDAGEAYCPGRFTALVRMLTPLLGSLRSLQVGFCVEEDPSDMRTVEFGELVHDEICSCIWETMREAVRVTKIDRCLLHLYDKD